MSETQATATREPIIRNRPWATTVAAGAAALLAVALFMTVAVLNVPHEVSDPELLAWWQDADNRTAGTISGLFAVLVAVTIAVVAGHLAGLTQARRAPAWLAFGRSMATAVTAVWLVTGAVRGVIGTLVDVGGEPLPGVDVLRFGTGLNYSLLDTSGMAVLGLFILAVTVVVFRTRVFGHWLAYIGAACATVMILAVLAGYGAWTTPLAVLWALGLSVAIWRGPAAAQP